MLFYEIGDISPEIEVELEEIIYKYQANKSYDLFDLISELFFPDDEYDPEISDQITPTADAAAEFILDLRDDLKLELPLQTEREIRQVNTEGYIDWKVLNKNIKELLDGQERIQAEVAAAVLETYYCYGDRLENWGLRYRPGFYGMYK